MSDPHLEPDLRTALARTRAFAHSHHKVARHDHYATVEALALRATTKALQAIPQDNEPWRSRFCPSAKPRAESSRGRERLHPHNPWRHRRSDEPRRLSKASLLADLTTILTSACRSSRGSRCRNVGDSARSRSAGRARATTPRPNAVGIYYGNPVRNLGLMTHGLTFARRCAKTSTWQFRRSVATDARRVPHVWTSGAHPVPDLERMDFMPSGGANPVVSNGA